MFDPDLKTGEDINNRELCKIFKCGPQGGMRKSNKTKSLVIVSNHIKSIYDDRWIEDVFHYTGMGQSCDQSIDFMQNKTLAQSDTNGVSVHLFEVFTSQIYTYIGAVTLADEPYTENQPDEKGQSRIVWMFPLKLKSEKAITVSKEKLDALADQKEKKARRLSDDEIFRRAKNSSKKIGFRNVESTQYERNVWVAQNAKRIANGICKLCNEPAPFMDKYGEPFLETHHIIWLSDGGEDTIKNTVALCPNCHRKMHVLNRADDIKKLTVKY